MSNPLNKNHPRLWLQGTPARGADFDLGSGAARIFVIKSKGTLITWNVEEKAQRERYNPNELTHAAIRSVTQVNPNSFSGRLKRTF